MPKSQFYPLYLDWKIKIGGDSMKTDKTKTKGKITITGTNWNKKSRSNTSQERRLRSDLIKSIKIINGIFNKSRHFFKFLHKSEIYSQCRFKKVAYLSACKTHGRCPWCNGYRRRKWTRRHEFKPWTRLMAFHIALIPLGKVWIQLFSLQLWVNSRTD